jgi:hypothetical protein
MIPNDINEFVAVPKDELRWIGTVSSNIFGPATENTPQQNPKKNRPITIVHKLKTNESDTANAANTLNTIIANLLPLVMNFPPANDPVTTPNIAAALISVLNLVASSFDHPNLALITGPV